MSAAAENLKSIFGRAIELPDPSARAVYLAEACGDNSSLKAEIEGLLAAMERAGDFLNHKPAKVDATGDFLTSATATVRKHIHAEEKTADFNPKGEHIGTVIAGKYKLNELIGEGGMGSVWRAQQSEPVKRFVAVKLIKSGMDSKTVLARFEAERQALAVMDHPNIAKILDGGVTESGSPFFVMELVKGVPITEFCDARKLTTTQRLELFVPVCQAIQHAHQKGIIHRDIKPSNVLIALYDDKPIPKVIDFGIAKATGQALTDNSYHTAFGGIVGTPEYMSPEQASLNNLDIDTRSDVYSLGVLLYELLTGMTPVDRKSLGQAALLEILRIVREVEAPRPSAKLSTSNAMASISANRDTEPKKLAELLKSELDWIVMKALEKDRSRRYDSANGLAKDLQRYLSGDAVEACPPTFGYRMRKAYLRNKAAVWVATAFVLLISVAFTVSSWLAVKAIRAEADAVIERDHTHEAFEIEQRARRRFRAVYRTSSVDLFRTVYMVDRDGVELIAFQNNSWKTIHMIRTLTDDYVTENGKTTAAKAIRAEGLMWRGVDHYGGMSYPEALASFRQAESIYLELVAGPNSGDTQADLTNCRMLAAFAALSAKRVSEANALAMQAEADARTLSDAYPENPEYRYEFALILWQMHTYRRMAGDESPGVSHLQESSRLFAQLVRSHPEVLHYRTGSANVLLAIATEHKWAKEPAEAIRLFGEAGTVLDAVYTPVREPVPMLRKWAFRGRARLLTEAERHAEAARDWNRVVEESPEPQINPYDRSEWALSLARSGDFIAARQQADQVSKSATFAAAYRNAALVFALSMDSPNSVTTERENWAAKAVVLLRRSIDFYDDVKDFDRPEFQSLRGRKDFLQLYSEVEGNARRKRGLELAPRQ